MSCRNIQLSRYGADLLTVYSVHCQPEYIAYQLAVCRAIQLNGNHVMKRGAGYPSGGSAMITFWRAIIAMKTVKYDVATARYILPFCKKQVCVFVTQKLPLCLSAGANLLPAPDGRMEGRGAVWAPRGLRINSRDNNR